MYFVFISENLGQVINHHVFGVIANASTYGVDFEASGANATATPVPATKTGLTPRIYMTMLLPFILALACVRDIRTLAYASIIANVLCVTGTVAPRYTGPATSTPLVTEFHQ